MGARPWSPEALATAVMITVWFSGTLHGAVYSPFSSRLPTLGLGAAQMTSPSGHRLRVPGKLAAHRREG